MNFENNINVQVRIRPANVNLSEIDGSNLIFNNTQYNFNKIFYEETQQTIFNFSIDPILEKFLGGYNCTIMAYGQTGSGKTYTMGLSREQIDREGEEEGIIPRALKYLLNQTDVENIRISAIEIYNEKIFDLLSPKKIPLQLMEFNDSIKIKQLSEYPLKNIYELKEILHRANGSRATRNTNMNINSSRSHAIFLIYCDTKRAKNNLLTFLDLAGSERINRSNVSGIGVREAILINKSLLALANVINAMHKKNKFIPFRESRLTRILRGVFLGNSYLLLIACISPLPSNKNESHYTLQYASRIAAILGKKIEKNKKTDTKNSDDLKNKIEKLENENRLLRERGSETLLLENEQLKNRIVELNKIIEQLKNDKQNSYMRNERIARRQITFADRSEIVEYDTSAKYKVLIENVNVKIMQILNNNLFYATHCGKLFLHNNNLIFSSKCINNFTLHINTIIFSEDSKLFHLDLNNKRQRLLNTFKSTIMLFYKHNNILIFTLKGGILIKYDLDRRSVIFEEQIYSHDITFIKIMNDFLYIGFENGLLSTISNNKLLKITDKIQSTIINIFTIGNFTFVFSKLTGLTIFNQKTIILNIEKFHRTEIISVFLRPAYFLSASTDGEIRQWKFNEVENTIETLKVNIFPSGIKHMIEYGKDFAVACFNRKLYVFNEN